MKKTIYIFILYIGFFNFNSTFAQQDRVFENIPFGTCLSKLDSIDLIKRLRTEFDSTIIRFNKNPKKTPLNLNDKWKLIYYVHTGYEEDHTAGSKNEFRSIGINNIYHNSEQEKWLTIAEIFNEFNISDTIPKNFYSKESYLENTFQINRYLDISDKFRGIWTPIISKDNYLIIYVSHSYPNGNAHSWLREYYYYFEKQKL
ncbi:hypothetical protein [Fluviicola taffensis]|uniref:Uncharacterized protein n=1 Tax=Fluviicola taffensis (strain DSM 16823 / NCIMB 13979 / RW262) TaxID=755732 RepID=F2IHW8_FLUTR|nr:hypothetical protein [Fluviicola taffensis]AEA45927.1 hypothetical protein Fluta_3963 [Fluviicola taffensis DSM 16823]